MKKTRTPTDRDPIDAYARRQAPALAAICDALRALIDKALPRATAKVWHGSPVWFAGENPVVGYDATAKKTVNLLFWNGQALGEAGLAPVGKYRAAQAVFADVADLDAKAIRRWLKKAATDVFDSKAFFARLRAERSRKADA
jgi:hypothetical protein